MGAKICGERKVVGIKKRPVWEPFLGENVGPWIFYSAG